MLFLETIANSISIRSGSSSGTRCRRRRGGSPAKGNMFLHTLIIATVLLAAVGHIFPVLGGEAGLAYALAEGTTTITAAADPTLIPLRAVARPQRTCPPVTLFQPTITATSAMGSGYASSSSSYVVEGAVVVGGGTSDVSSATGAVLGASTTVTVADSLIRDGSLTLYMASLHPDVVFRSGTAVTFKYPSVNGVRDPNALKRLIGDGSAISLDSAAASDAGNPTTVAIAAGAGDAGENRPRCTVTQRPVYFPNIARGGVAEVQSTAHDGKYFSFVNTRDVFYAEYPSATFDNRSVLACTFVPVAGYSLRVPETLEVYTTAAPTNESSATCAGAYYLGTLHVTPSDTSALASTVNVLTTLAMLGTLAAVPFVGVSAMVDLQLFVILMQSGCSSSYYRDWVEVPKYFVAPFWDTGASGIVGFNCLLVVIFIAIHFFVTYLIFKLACFERKTLIFRMSQTLFPSLSFHFINLAMMGIYYGTFDLFQDSEETTMKAVAAIGVLVVIAMPITHAILESARFMRLTFHKCNWGLLESESTNVIRERDIPLGIRFKLAFLPRGVYGPPKQLKRFFGVVGPFSSKRFIIFDRLYRFALVLFLVALPGVMDCAIVYALFAVCCVLGSFVFIAVGAHRSQITNLIAIITLLLLGGLGVLMAISVGLPSNGIEAGKAVVAIFTIFACALHASVGVYVHFAETARLELMKEERRRIDAENAEIAARDGTAAPIIRQRIRPNGRGGDRDDLTESGTMSVASYYFDDDDDDETSTMLGKSHEDNDGSSSMRSPSHHNNHRGHNNNNNSTAPPLFGPSGYGQYGAGGEGSPSMYPSDDQQQQQHGSRYQNGGKSGAAGRGRNNSNPPEVESYTVLPDDGGDGGGDDYYDANGKRRHRKDKSSHRHRSHRGNKDQHQYADGEDASAAAGGGGGGGANGNGNDVDFDSDDDEEYREAQRRRAQRKAEKRARRQAEKESQQAAKEAAQYARQFPLFAPGQQGPSPPPVSTPERQIPSFLINAKNLSMSQQQLQNQQSTTNGNTAEDGGGGGGDASNNAADGGGGDAYPVEQQQHEQLRPPPQAVPIGMGMGPADSSAAAGGFGNGGASPATPVAHSYHQVHPMVGSGHHTAGGGTHTVGMTASPISNSNIIVHDIQSPPQQTFMAGGGDMGAGGGGSTTANTTSYVTNNNGNVVTRHPLPQQQPAMGLSQIGNFVMSVSPSNTYLLDGSQQRNGGGGGGPPLFQQQQQQGHGYGQGQQQPPPPPLPQSLQQYHQQQQQQSQGHGFSSGHYNPSSFSNENLLSRNNTFNTNSYNMPSGNGGGFGGGGFGGGHQMGHHHQSFANSNNFGGNGGMMPTMMSGGGGNGGGGNAANPNSGNGQPLNPMQHLQMLQQQHLRNKQQQQQQQQFEMLQQQQQRHFQQQQQMQMQMQMQQQQYYNGSGGAGNYGGGPQQQQQQQLQRYNSLDYVSSHRSGGGSIAMHNNNGSTNFGGGGDAHSNHNNHRYPPNALPPRGGFGVGPAMAAGGPRSNSLTGGDDGYSGGGGTNSTNSGAPVMAISEFQQQQQHPQQQQQQRSGSSNGYFGGGQQQFGGGANGGMQQQQYQQPYHQQYHHQQQQYQQQGAGGHLLPHGHTAQLDGVEAYSPSDYSHPELPPVGGGSRRSAHPQGNDNTNNTNYDDGAVEMMPAGAGPRLGGSRAPPPHPERSPVMGAADQEQHPLAMPEN